MARPEEKFVTFEIDGREVSAPEGAMLVDGAKYGDVEIPYFCYEPKLGAPVGACRMCLVEIEGIPKLQTACSTAAKDGMVVVTTSDKVKSAQNAVVEFLLVNHPLDCPVCDKGGECPLQDIAYGWGPGRSRYIEPKRHFKKPLELSPLVAIDRERCILCYRCVRFSQEISEDYQLVFLERGDHTYVGTHDGRPYVGPFSGNITELCPVGALTSTSFRFRARPWDIQNAGTVCTICPSQCNVQLTVRDDTKVVRVMSRDNVEVDDGWLCDRGRYGFQAFHAPERITQPLLRDGGELRPVSWERALDEATKALDRAGERAAALVGGEAVNEEGSLFQFLMRNVLGSPHVDSRVGGALDPEQARVLARPDLSAKVSDIDYAGAILVLDTELIDEMPILDLRVRKAARRSDAPVVVASSRPSTLDRSAVASLRFAPGASEAALAALVGALSGEGDLDDLTRRARSGPPGTRPPRRLGRRRNPRGRRRPARRGRRGCALGRARHARSARGAGHIGAARARAPSRDRERRRRRPDRGAERDERPRAARGRLPAQPEGRPPGGRRRRDRRRRHGRRARRGPRRDPAVPGRPGALRARRRRVERGPGARERGDRLQRLRHAVPQRARDRRLPRRVVRREGGHGHAPGRPPAARAGEHRQARRGALAAAGAAGPDLDAARVGVPPERAGRLQPDHRDGAVLRRPDLRGDLRPRAALAGA